MQTCHGRPGPLRRVGAGDRVAYYSPDTVFGGTDRLQSFVSIGIVQPGEAYEFDMGGGLVPWRRDVRYADALETPIAPMIERLAFIENPKKWGYKFRFGLFDVGDADMALIARSMKADLKTLAL